MSAGDQAVADRPVTPRDTSGLALGRAGAGNQRGVTHGCHSPMQMRPRAQEIADGLRPIVPGYQPHLERAEQWLDGKGYWTQAGKPRPPLVLLSTWQAEARRQLSALGMDNTAPRTTGQFDLAALIAAARTVDGAAA